MPHVLVAFILHEFLERVRDRWLIIVTILFALLATGVIHFAQQDSADNTRLLAGASMITLCTLFVPLVALFLGHDAIVGEVENNSLRLILSLPINRIQIIFCKYFARSLALTFSILIGFGVAISSVQFENKNSLFGLLVPTVCLGASFLSLGIATSVFAKKRSTAISIAISFWFLLVFFFDLAVLGVLIISKGSVPVQIVNSLVMFNPAGLYRIILMGEYANTDVLSSFGFTMNVPDSITVAVIWSIWILYPVIFASLMFHNRMSLRR